MKVRFAVAPPAGIGDLDGFTALIGLIEELGFDTVWLSDVPVAGALDPLVGLCFAAATTTRLKLGANFVPIGRNPFRLAKELAALDRLSRGRVLLSLVPGLDQPGERKVLGLAAGDRWRYIEETIALLRRWWAGEVVDYTSSRFDVPSIGAPVLPLQEPLELWTGGIGPRALRIAGSLSDGWLGAALTPAEAGAARRRIEEAAADASRSIDSEHFGLSLSYCRDDSLPERALEGLKARRPGVDPRDLIPTGRSGLRSAVAAYLDAGVSKFVVRPVAGSDNWAEELAWLADTLLDLQS